MPGQFTDKNGGLMAGHSSKWADENRRKNSYQAGQGSRGSRNQGTGTAGRAQTVASDEVDTSKMNPEEKLRYFNKLGLLNPTQKKQLADIDAQKSQPKEEPKPSEAPKSAPSSVNPVKELSDKLQKVFKDKPQLLMGIVNDLKAVPKDDLKDTAERILQAMNKSTSNNPAEVFSTISQAINPHEVPHTPDVQDEPEDIQFDDEEEELGQQQKDDAENSEWRKTHLMPKPKREWYNNDGDYQAAINQANAIGMNKKAYNIAMTAAEDASHDWSKGYNPKGFKSENDMVNHYIDSYWDEIEQALEQDNSTEQSDSNTGMPKVQWTDQNTKDMKGWMDWFAEKGKEVGEPKKSINSMLSWFKDQIGNDPRKLQHAERDLVNGMDAYDPDEMSEFDYMYNTLEDSFRQYDEGNTRYK